MMSEKTSAKLVEDYQSGDESAAQELFDRYVNRLIALARSRLTSAMKRRVAPEDIVQSVYRSFFRNVQADRFEVNQNGQLWGLLAAITINKVRDKSKFHRAQKRNISAEQSMNASQSCYGLVPARFADEPTIQDAAALEEQLKLTLEELSHQQREIFELYLQNVSQDQIANKVRRSERTVRRVLEEVRTVLEEKLKAES